MYDFSPIKEEVRRILLAVLKIPATETLKIRPTQSGKIPDGVGDVQRRPRSAVETSGKREKHTGSRRATSTLDPILTPTEARATRLAVHMSRGSDGGRWLKGRTRVIHRTGRREGR